MQVVILAGGMGTRLSEITKTIPKPMVDISGKPILIRLMEHYSSFGHNDFLIAAGYKQDVIKKFFSDFMIINSDLIVDMELKTIRMENSKYKKWRIQIVDTGFETMTGGRIKRLHQLLSDDFLLSYSDGLGNVNLDKVIQQHRSGNLIATLTAVKNISRFGHIEFDNNKVNKFSEKPIDINSFINAGYYVLNKKILDYIVGDNCVFETDVLPKLVNIQELGCYLHEGFWHPMDSLRDKELLENLILENKIPPWEKFE